VIWNYLEFACHKQKHPWRSTPPGSWECHMPGVDDHRWPKRTPGSYCAMATPTGRAETPWITSFATCVSQNVTPGYRNIMKYSWWQGREKERERDVKLLFNYQYRFYVYIYCKMFFSRGTACINPYKSFKKHFQYDIQISCIKWSVNCWFNGQPLATHLQTCRFTWGASILVSAAKHPLRSCNSAPPMWSTISSCYS